MRTFIITTLSAATLFGSMALANAMPLVDASPAAGREITQVRFGCGPGFHPNPFGRCVPNGFGRPGWRGPGWRGPGWRGPGWRGPGWRGPGYNRF